MRRTISALAFLAGLELAGLGLAGPGLAQNAADPPKPAESATNPAGLPLDRSKVPAPEVVVPSVLPPPAPSVQPEAKDGAAPAK